MWPFKRKPHIEVQERGHIGPFWLRIVAANGEILFTSEIYSSESNARRAAKTLALATGLKVKA